MDVDVVAVAASGLGTVDHGKDSTTAGWWTAFRPARDMACR